jgi:hypothetical protein
VYGYGATGSGASKSCRLGICAVCNRLLGRIFWIIGGKISGTKILLHCKASRSAMCPSALLNGELKKSHEVSKEQ